MAIATSISTSFRGSELTTVSTQMSAAGAAALLPTPSEAPARLRYPAASLGPQTTAWLARTSIAGERCGLPPVV